MAWFKKGEPQDLTELWARRDRAMALLQTQPEAARAEIGRVHRAIWRVAGTRSLDTARILIDGSHTSLVCGATQAAFTAARTALATAIRLDGPGGLVTAQARVALGNVHTEQGKYAEAMALYQETLNALTGQDAAAPADQRAAAHSGLALCHQSLGDHDSALRHCRVAARLQAETHGPDSTEALSAELAVSAELWAVGNAHDALALRERVHGILLATLGPARPETAAARDLLASAYRALGHPDKAAALGI